MSNFLITGIGRTGTKFLAQALATGEGWLVKHEVKPPKTVNRKTRAIYRFEKQRNRYGEVNSLVRYWLLDIPATKKAVIIRNPEEVVLSVFNRHEEETATRLIGEFDLLDHYIRLGLKTLRFEEFTKNRDTVEQIADWLGISQLGEFSMEPINSTTERKAESYKQITNQIPLRLRDEVARFWLRYYENRK